MTRAEVGLRLLGKNQRGFDRDSSSIWIRRGRENFGRETARFRSGCRRKATARGGLAGPRLRARGGKGRRKRAARERKLGRLAGFRSKVILVSFFSKFYSGLSLNQIQFKFKRILLESKSKPHNKTK